MSDQELFYLLALLRVDGVGDVMAKKLLTNFRTAEEVFNAKSSQIAAIDGVGTVLLKKLKDKTIFERANHELEFIKSNGISASFFQDESYPERLKHCFDAPVLIFKAGNIDLNKKKIISIVGTRQITSYGTEFCKKLI